MALNIYLYSDIFVGKFDKTYSAWLQRILLYIEYFCQTTFAMPCHDHVPTMLHDVKDVQVIRKGFLNPPARWNRFNVFRL